MSVQQSLQTTPPVRFASPPTPPATEEKTSTSILEILAEVRRRKEGWGRSYTDEHWLRFRLEEHQYDTLQYQLQKTGLWGYYEDKVRHHYFPTYQLYILQMPSLLHEALISQITEAVIFQLRAIARSDGPSAKFAEDIGSYNSATIVSKIAKYGPHDPDGSFRHFYAQSPGVILEVSYSQKRKDLSRLADAYILGSHANIRVVIGIDVEYKGSKAASVSIWRPRIAVNAKGRKELSVVQTVKAKLFRDEEGKLVPNSQAILQLQLQDFGAPKFAEQFPDLTQSIHLSAEDLYAFLERAETIVRRSNANEGVAGGGETWEDIQSRESTPTEELDPHREGEFKKQEKKVARKARKDDASYEPGSSEEQLW